MSFAKLLSRAQIGIDAPEVSVEVHLSGGLPSFAIVGLAETAVRESKERVRSALINSGFDYPQRRITINLAPADLPKEGGRYDLAIALGILIASHQLSTDHLENAEVYGELGLDGEVRQLKGLFPAAAQAGLAKRVIVVPSSNAQEVMLAGAQQIVAAEYLRVLTEQLSQPKLALSDVQSRVTQTKRLNGTNMADICGQPQARRALEVAASGAHNLLLTGPPGAGKSLLASAIPSILPPLVGESLIETAAVYSIAGMAVEPLFTGQRPFRAPHHSASAPALVGGGSSPRPGEISLAHGGVLFLDELPEFSRSVLEVLREPLETGEILISRASRSLRFPANFSLIAARNPCPCGYQGDGTDRCSCSSAQVDRYRARVSGPLLDRFDMLLSVEALAPEALLNPSKGNETSETVAHRVRAARDRALARQGKLNADLKASELMRLLEGQGSLQSQFTEIASQMKLSARACHRILRVSRTLADLDSEERIELAHLYEALSFRG